MFILTTEDKGFVLILLDFSDFDKSRFFLPDFFQQNRCRFIIRILWNQFATNSKVKNFLSEKFCINHEIDHLKKNPTVERNTRRRLVFSDFVERKNCDSEHACSLLQIDSSFFNLPDQFFQRLDCLRNALALGFNFFKKFRQCVVIGRFALFLDP